MTSLSQRFTQDVLFNTAARAAAGQLAVNHDRRHAADTVLSGAAYSLLLMHVMHYDLVFGAGQLANGFNRVFTGFATGAEDLNSVRHVYVLLVRSFC